MKIAYPVTDYYPLSTLTTDGDIAARNAGIPARLPGSILGTYLRSLGVGVAPGYAFMRLRDTGIHINSDTRNAGGNQVITGVGFQSSAVIFLATDDDDTQDNMSWGFDDFTQHRCLRRSDNGTNFDIDIGSSINVRLNVGNIIQGQVNVVGADGFTIAWSLNGARTANFVYLCLP